MNIVCPNCGTSYDVAATALGAQPVPTYDPEAEAQLYDGLTPAGVGLRT